MEIAEYEQMRKGHKTVAPKKHLVIPHRQESTSHAESKHNALGTNVDIGNYKHQGGIDSRDARDR